MALYPYNHKLGQRISTDIAGVAMDRAFLAHFQVAALSATVADTNGVHLAKTNPAINVAAECVVEAASAETDILTVSSTVAIGVGANVLKILLTTADDDTLAVTETAATYTINIALANTTATKNTASLIESAIQTLSTVGTIPVDVSAFTCAAGGNWDTAAKATGEVAAVDFTGGLSPVDVLTTDIIALSVPRNITATTGGTGGDIKAVQVTITGTNYADEVISEVLPIFTVNSATTVTGSKAFKTVTSISIPAHDGLAATTEIGFGEVLGLPWLLPYNTVLSSFFDNAAASGAPTVTTSLTLIESNTLDMHNALNSKIVDAYLIV